MLSVRLSMVGLQVPKQHAARWSSEAAAMAGGADSVWEIPWSQLAGPGKPHSKL